MSNRIGISKCFAVLVLFTGCGDGLASSLGGNSSDGGAPSDVDGGASFDGESQPTLGAFGRPCDVLGNSQTPMASFSPSGDTVALTVGGPGHIELHATSDGHLVTGFDAHFGLVMDMAFSPKDDLLATTGVDGSLKLWRGGVLVAQRQISLRPATQLAWSHDGVSLVVVDQSGPITLLRVQGNDLATGWTVPRNRRSQRPFFSKDDSILRVGDPLASASDQPGACILQVADGSARCFDGPDLTDSYFRAQSLDGSVIAYSDGYLQHVTIERDDRLVWQRGLFGSQATGIAFTADAKNIAIWDGATSDPVRLYDVGTGNQLETLPWATNTARSILFSPDGRWALVFDSLDDGGAARLVNLSSNGSLTLAIQPGRSDSLGGRVSLSADGTKMASLFWLSSKPYDTALQVWNLVTRQRGLLIPWSFDTPWVPALSAKGDLLYGTELAPQSDPASASQSGIRFESLTDPALSSKWWLQELVALALANDGRTLAMATFNYDTDAQWSIELYDPLTGLPTTKGFRIGSHPTTTIAFSPDDQQIAVLRSDMFAGGSDTGKDLSVWRVADGQLLFESGGHTRAPVAMAFSPDGTTLVVMGNGGADSPGIDVYDARHWRWLRTLESSHNPRTSVHYSPDGKLMTVSADDGTHVWRTSDWQGYDAFGTTQYSGAVFMPDNQRVLEIGTGIVWCAPASP